MAPVMSGDVHSASMSRRHRRRRNGRRRLTTCSRYNEQRYYSYDSVVSFNLLAVTL